MRSPSPRGGPPPPRRPPVFGGPRRGGGPGGVGAGFCDLCAVTELRTLEQRYDVAGCLMQGKVYSEIRRETGASSATVSRVNRMLNYGTGQVAQSVRYDLEHAPGGQPGPTQPDTQKGDSL